MQDKTWLFLIATVLNFKCATASGASKTLH